MLSESSWDMQMKKLSSMQMSNQTIIELKTSSIHIQKYPLGFAGLKTSYIQIGREF